MAGNLGRFLQLVAPFESCVLMVRPLPSCMMILRLQHHSKRQGTSWSHNMVT